MLVWNRAADCEEVKREEETTFEVKEAPLMLVAVLVPYTQHREKTKQERRTARPHEHNATARGESASAGMMRRDRNETEGEREDLTFGWRSLAVDSLSKRTHCSDAHNRFAQRHRKNTRNGKARCDKRVLRRCF